jgi:tetratricopeptide (TPR) repeat protein
VGLFFFSTFAVGAFALLNLLLVVLGPWKGPLAGLAGAIVAASYVAAAGDLWRRTSSRRVEAEAERRDRDLREGTAAYVRGELEKARACFLRWYRSDPSDFEAAFRLGVTCARQGDVRWARHWLRRTRKLDVDGKWHWELARELELLKKKKAAPAGGRPRATPREVAVEG